MCCLWTKILVVNYFSPLLTVYRLNVEYTCVSFSFSVFNVSIGKDFLDVIY